MYHYRESGLDNIYLVDGYTIEQDEDYGELFSIEDVEGLHAEILRHLIELPRPLNGAEFRFIRTEMDLSQKALGGMIGSNEQSVAKWEKSRDKPIGNRVADRMLKILASEHIGQTGEVAKLLREIADLDSEVAEYQFRLERAEDGWRPQEAA